MPEIDFAFLADAAETIPGQKFHVLGGGIARIGGPTFPLRHPHLALVVGLLVTAPETDREHEIRFVLLDPDGHEVTSATGSLVARGHDDGRDTILTFSLDLWNLTFPAPGDYSFRILVNGSERKRLGLVLVRPVDQPAARRPSRRRGRDWRTCTRGPARHERPAIDEAALVAARAATGRWPRPRERGATRWATLLEPLPDALRDGPIWSCAGSPMRAGRPTARRIRSATRCRRRDRAAARGDRPPAEGARTARREAGRAAVPAQYTNGKHPSRARAVRGIVPGSGPRATPPRGPT